MLPLFVLFLTSPFNNLFCRCKDNTISKMTDQPAGKGPPSVIMLVFSVLTHILLLAPVIYIVTLAFEKFNLFSWHPICMSVGVSSQPMLITQRNNEW